MNEIDDDDYVDELPARPGKEIPAADRELLELAARALGAVRVEDVDGEQWLILHFADGSEVHGWNPLLFYADTFELAVELVLQIDPDAVEARVFRSSSAEPLALCRVKECGDDRKATTARAVVRAAAEIGKQHS